MATFLLARPPSGAPLSPSLEALPYRRRYEVRTTIQCESAQMPVFVTSRLVTLEEELLECTVV